MVLPGLGKVARGAETAYIHVARELAANSRVEVDLFGSGELREPGIRFHRVPCAGRERYQWAPGLPLARNAYQLEEAGFILRLAASGLYKAHRYDAVIHSGFPYTNWFLRTNRPRKGPAVVYWAQNGDWACTSSRSEFRFFGCDGLICLSPEQLARNEKRWNAVLVPNGVDPAKFHPLDQELPCRPANWPAVKRVAIMASALVPTKRVEDAVRAVAQLPETGLVVAGDGPLREQLQKLGDELMPGRLLLAGSVPHQKLAGWLRQADLFLHTAEKEPFGIVYLEAMASGLPVVAPDEPTARWIVGNAGRFAPVGDPEGIAREIRWLLDSGYAPVYGDLARSRVETGWSWKNQADRILDFLQQCAVKTGRDKACLV